MFLKFQQLEQGERPDEWVTGHHGSVVECDVYTVDKKKRTVFCVRAGNRVWQEGFTPGEFWNVFVMNDSGQTVDTLEFKPVN